MTVAHRPPADFYKDRDDPRTQKAESLVHDYLRSLVDWVCVDTRWEKIGWDFEMRSGLVVMRLDVKADRYIDETRRAPFETHHVYRDGLVKPGWGRNPNLDVVAVVDTQRWTCWMLDAPALREHVSRRTRNGGLPEGWKVIARENPGKTTHGFAIPLKEIQNAVRRIIDFS